VSGQGETRLRIGADHPAFAGHFPGHPVVPAVVLLAEAMAAIESTTGTPPEGWTLASAKFHRPVGPDAELVIDHSDTPAGCRFEIRVDESVVASGTLARAEPG
jgi:3-hydroxyacyl-[acyl-carrier-protein] dehydratase